MTARRTTLFMALALIAGLAAAPATWAQTTVYDLTGELCLSGSGVIDPDGDGPLPSFTYCVMNGRLAAGTALEMDDIDGLPPVPGQASSVEDANLFKGNTGNDPDLPPVAGATYIDWADLPILPLTGAGAAPLGSVENHRILDFTANSDLTILRPQSSSCLNDGSALPKEDFTQSYIANTENILYFAQERRTNNGNSVYYWLLTRKPPIVMQNADCGSNTRGQMLYNLSEGDVELLVNFPDSSDPAGGGVFFRNYSGAESGYIPIRDAVFAAGWGGLTTAPIENLSINIRITGDDDDSFGPWGGISAQGNPVATGTYTTATLAEWGVDLSSLLHGVSLCGQSLYITGVSRASTGQVGSLDEPAALKDVVGPKLYSFGQISATATLTPGCNLSFGFSAAAFGLDGVTPLDPSEFTCSWSCSDSDGRGVTIDDDACSGTGTIPAGDMSPDTVSCTLTVTETATACSDDSDGMAEVMAPITVTIAPDNNSLGCTVPGTPGSDAGNVGAGVNFSATIAGGDGSYTRTWTVTGPNTSTCAANAMTCNVDIPDGAFCGRTNVYVTVDDGSAMCSPAQSETEEVVKSTTVTATNL